ncbi:acetyltransferase (GNAT) family protein [Planomicrobium soli]|uniref:Lipid II:glycine glycyltransferase n=1 Tax=Planomicrobium soli TaxID=1176648 RepID=A0A2P8H3L4_9BACL|nr:acetyltransferase (GNAT) family protein [Planomicrobium soli]
MKDIYFDKNYGVLYEEVENGKSELYKFEHPLGEVHHLFIKREIPIHIGEETFYDLVTPYGYGGPIVVNSKEGEKSQLIQAFEEEFQAYCKQNKIVSEFIRFHPILNNAQDFQEYYEIESIRKTVGTNLKEYDDPVQQEFSKTARKNVRKALQAGVEFQITVNPKELKNFKEIYYSTMQRNNAASYYFFDDNYFDKCTELFGDRILLTEVTYQAKVIGIGFNFLYNNILHTNLSGTLEEYHHLSPAYVLQYAITVWGKENGIDLIHDGGGRTNSEDDSLFMFKKQFGKNTRFQFCVGRKIWDEEIYKKLCQAAGVDRDLELDFFPAYRKRVLKEVESR